MEDKPKGSKFFIYILTCVATLGGFLFGYDTGIVSGSMLLIKPYFHLSTVWVEAIVSATTGSAAVSSIFAGICTDFIGRKKTIMTASVFFTIGAIIMSICNTRIILLIGRVVVGIGLGFSSMSVPLYVAEAAPADIRGRLVTLNQLSICVGILISSIVAGCLSGLKTTGWRYMLGLGAVPAIIQFVGFFFLPESPRWLVAKERTEEAAAVLTKTRHVENVKKELEDIIKVVERDNKIKQEGGRSALFRIFKTRHVLKASLIGSILMAFHQLTGIDAVIYYSATILRMAGFEVSQAIWLAVIPNAVLFLATFFGISLVERLGRRFLLLISTAGLGIALGVLAVGFQLSSIYSPNVNVTETFVDTNFTNDCGLKYSTCDSCISDTECGFCFSDLHDGSCLPVDDANKETSSVGRCQFSKLENSSFHFDYGFCPTDYSWMPILGMVLFVLCFAPGMGPMPWTINSEIYPLWARSTCISISTATNWVCNLVISFTFITLTETITRYGTFWLLSGICLLAFIFIFIFIPETRDKTLEEVEQLFIKNPDSKPKNYNSVNDAEDYNTRF